MNQNTPHAFRSLIAGFGFAIASLLLGLLFPGCATGPGDAATARAPRWQPHDFTFATQTQVSNAFLVPFTAMITSPDGRTFSQPGFYDGAGVWKVRVAADQPGRWSVVTQSDLPDLHGRRATLICTNVKSKSHGGLRVDPQNPHHFVFEDGARFFLMGYECDWLWALDAGDSRLPNIRPFLRKLSNHGFNLVVLNVYAHDTSWREGKTEAADYGPPPIFPWEGDNFKPDHLRLNLPFWQHYDRVIQALYEQGMIAHILIKVYNKRVKWPTRESEADDLYFRTVMARYAAYPNIIWDFSKEAHNEKSLDYKLNRLRFIEAHDPYQRLRTVHDDDANNDAGVYDTLTHFRADQQHSKFRDKILEQRARRAWPVANVEFGYEQGLGGPEDKTYRVVQSAEDLVGRAWEIAMAGGYTVYYYTFSAWDVICPEDTPIGYAYFKQMRDFFETTRYWKLATAEGVASEGWALADPGREYVIGLPKARTFTLNIRGELHGEWFNPVTAQRVAIDPVRSGQHHLQPPSGWTGLAVLHLR